eukprot:Hpha_TRINITY_DN31024_c0_g1::TRINITY_DN31024_c0_g1_i1::g.63919::m.63919
MGGASDCDDECAAHTCSCCCGVRLEMTAKERRLFLQKTLLVVVVTFALYPLIRMKSSVPKLAFAIALIALHVVVLFVYFYKVKLKTLDPDWRAVTGRVVALILMIGLLFLAARNEQNGNDVVLLLEMAGLCVIHTFILLLLLVRVRYSTSDEKGHLIQDQEEGGGAAVE